MLLEQLEYRVGPAVAAQARVDGNPVAAARHPPGHAVRRPIRRPLQDDELGGLLDGQLAKQNRIHEAEDRRVRADAKRKARHGQCGERLLSAHRAERVAHISHQGIERLESQRLADARLGLLDASELDERRASRLSRRHAVANLCFRRPRNVIRQVAVERLLDLVAPQQPADERAKAVQEGHALRSTLAIALVTRSQRCSSCSRRLRPRAVSS